MDMRAKIRLVLPLLFLLSATALVLAVTQPEGPSTLTVVNSTRRQAGSALTTQATAGNITHLIVQGQTVTQSWQGFVGNITGTITLDDANNNTLYDWSLADPEGEIYATYLSQVNWTAGSVLCWNWTIATASYLQLAELETNPAAGDGAPSVYGGIGAAIDDVDGVNETFSAPGAGVHSNFFAGPQAITVNATDSACPVTRLYNNVGGGAFQEVLLYTDGTGANNDGVIYTSILNQSATGYDAAKHDFEMIVGEDGHNGNVAVTTYYFYVELQ